MTVADLKKILTEVPEGVSPEDFDALPVWLSDDGVFAHADFESSGYTTADDAHDAKATQSGGFVVLYLKLRQ